MSEGFMEWLWRGMVEGLGWELVALAFAALLYTLRLPQSEIKTIGLATAISIAASVFIFYFMSIGPYSWEFVDDHDEDGTEFNIKCEYRWRFAALLPDNNYEIIHDQADVDGKQVINVSWVRPRVLVFFFSVPKPNGQHIAAVNFDGRNDLRIEGKPSGVRVTVQKRCPIRLRF